MVLPQDYFDRSHIIAGHNGGFQVGPQTQRGDLLDVKLIVMDIAHIDVLSRVGDQRIQNVGVKAGSFSL